MHRVVMLWRASLWVLLGVACLGANTCGTVETQTATVSQDTSTVSEDLVSLVPGVAGELLHSESDSAARIYQPTAGSTYRQDEVISFIGSAVVAESESPLQEVEADSLRWTSDIDGLIARGNSFEVCLSPGTHSVTLAGTGPAGTSIETSIVVTITE